MNEAYDIEATLTAVNSELHRFRIFQTAVKSVFTEDPALNKAPPVIHSIRTRIKDDDHLREKISQKSRELDPITPENVFDRITDIAGVRILHLYQQQFSKIHDCIQRQLEQDDWALYEKPKAYTWDPESKEFFANHDLEVEVKESFYTSIHYVIKPRADSIVTCEIQVRTLFEEIWGEIDHLINYPHQTDILACREQIRVLARLVGAGSRLADSIFRTFEEEFKLRKKE